MFPRLPTFAQKPKKMKKTGTGSFFTGEVKWPRLKLQSLKGEKPILFFFLFFFFFLEIHFVLQPHLQIDKFKGQQMWESLIDL